MKQMHYDQEFFQADYYLIHQYKKYLDCSGCGVTALPNWARSLKSAASSTTPTCKMGIAPWKLHSVEML